jgi:hypothetical protein
VIPDFDERGYLPPGIHLGTLAEVVERFGRGSEVREAQAASLGWLMPLCKSAGIARCVLNGSFVTDVLEPNDVDCVLLQGPAYRRRTAAARRLRAGLPFVDLKVVKQKDFDFLTGVIFGSDREMRPKGVVEVMLDD